jgi:DNA polymerase-3 subunit epsilon
MRCRSARRSPTSSPWPMAKSILFFDTETSGLWKDALDARHPSQPHLVQLSTKVVRCADRKIMGRATWLVRPEGWSIEPEAQAVHHISEADCYAYGLPLANVLLQLQAACRTAELAVAHHVQFDRAVILSAIGRTNTPTIWWDRMANSFGCTMERATDIVRMPGNFGTHKFPKLEEAMDWFFPAEAPYQTRHTAEADTDACERLWWAMDDMEKLNAHSATNRVSPVVGPQTPPAA